MGGNRELDLALRWLEIATGSFVILGIVALFFTAIQTTEIEGPWTQRLRYPLYARFENIGTMQIRAPVKVAGVRVGRVTAIRLDEKTYEAVVELSIDGKYVFPEDTIASIYTSGLLGEQYIALEPGGSEEILKPGDEIEITQSALVLEELISQFIGKIGGK